MKLIPLLALALASATAFAAELPKEITLNGKVKLTRVVPIKWDEDFVTVRHSRGTDPIQYRYMDPVAREAFEAQRDIELAKPTEVAAPTAQTQQPQPAEPAPGTFDPNAHQKELDRATAIQAALDAKEVIVGMTAEQVRQVKGKPTYTNAFSDSTGRREEWIYEVKPNNKIIALNRSGEPSRVPPPNKLHIRMKDGIVESVELKDGKNERNKTIVRPVWN